MDKGSVEKRLNAVRGCALWVNQKKESLDSFFFMRCGA